MSSAVEKIEGSASQVQAVLTPMDMLARAVDAGAGLEMVEKLMGLQERWEKNQARKAFDAAIAAAKAEITPIARTGTGHNDKRYATFAAIAKAVDPILSQHGLSYRFRTAQADRISVTCVLSHQAGHYEETTLAGPADTSGSKNAIQAIGSTLSYLQRYSLVQMLGLASADDDDGKSSATVAYAAPAGSVSAEQIQQLRDALTEKGASEKAFCGWAKVKRIEDVREELFDACMDGIKSFKKGTAK